MCMLATWHTNVFFTGESCAHSTCCHWTLCQHTRTSPLNVQPPLGLLLSLQLEGRQGGEAKTILPCTALCKNARAHTSSPTCPVPFQSNPRLHMLIKLAHSPLLSSSSLRIPLVIFRRPAPTHGHLSHTQPSRPPTPHPPHVSVQARTSHLSSAHCTSPAPTPFPGTDFSLATPMFPQALVSCYAHRCPSHRLPTPPGPAGLEEAGVSSTSFPTLPPPNPPLLQRLERALPVVPWPPKDQSPSLGNQTRFI